MKNFLYTTLLYVWIAVFGLLVSMPTHVLADGDCNRFGSTCYVWGIWVLHSDQEPAPTLITTIQRTINIIFALLATVATLICIYAWFKMLTSWWDSKWYDAGLKILKNAALWLAIIALSRIIVSGVLRFVDTASEWKSMVANTD